MPLISRTWSKYIEEVLSHLKYLVRTLKPNNPEFKNVLDKYTGIKKVLEGFERRSSGKTKKAKPKPSTTPKLKTPIT